MKARYKAVWFDLDGTLFDTAPDLIATVNRTLAEHGYPPAPAGVILPYTGHGSRQMLQHALSTTADDPRLPALQEAFYAHYLRHVAEETRSAAIRLLPPSPIPHRLPTPVRWRECGLNKR